MIEREEFFLRYFDDIRSLFLDIFQSGFDTIGMGTIEEVERLNNLAVRCGMDSLSKLFRRFVQTVKDDMHGTKRNNGDITKAYFEIIQYVNCAENRVMYDRAESIYIREE